MILTLTGFEDRDRDWVKDMIVLSGAKYTSYFTKHNHAIICKRYAVEKFFFKSCRGWGANPGSFNFVYFLISSLYR
jgi:hypothetical protein